MTAMERPERGRRGGRRGQAASRREQETRPGRPWRVENHLAPAQLLTREQVETIHDASMRLLETLGVECWSEDALDRFARAGALVDREGRTVRLDRALVADLVARAPASVTLTPRNPERAVTLGGRDMVTTLVAGPPAVHDRVQGRRSSNMADYENLLRLAQGADAVHMLGNQVAAPIELPAETRHLDCYRANLALTDKAYHCTAIGRERAIDGIAMMALSRGLSGPGAMIDSPGVATIISVNSPRRLDGEMADGLIAMAAYGQVAVVTPFTLMGAMAPVTLAAALAQQNAEALFGICLAQIVRPGAPVVYGAFTSNVDMRSGAPAFGTPENVQATIASGQLARRYGLPYRASPANAANTVDAQAAWETQMALWGCAMGGANLLYHAAGWLEGGLCASYEKVMIDVAMLEALFASLQPVVVDEDALGLDAMARVGPGGHFFGDAHTMARYATAFHPAPLSDWRNVAAWAADGAHTAAERATEAWQKALAEYERPAMDPAVAEALDAYVARRKEGAPAPGR